MVKTTITISILLIAATTAWGQQPDRRAKTMMRQQVKYARLVKHMEPDTAIQKMNSSLTMNNRPEARALLEKYRYGFYHRKATYSLTTGYRDAAGIAGIKLEERFFRLGNRLQPLMLVGFSPITGLRAGAGINYFLSSEKHKVMPMLNAQWVYSSGNRMASSIKKDSFYCITGKGFYLNIAAGVKIKPFSTRRDNVTGPPPFKSLYDVKVLAGYSYAWQHPGIDSMPVAESGWDFKMKRIRNNINSGFFVEVCIGIDIPFINQALLDQKEERGALKQEGKAQ